MKLLLSTITLALLCSAANGQNADTLQQAMANPERPAQDKARDAIRKAPEILDFMGVKEGDTVLDVIAMGGWYTEVLSYAVGDSGKVYMQNNPIPVTEMSADERNERLNFHDVYNRSTTDADNMLKSILGALKPGGILAILDHEGNAGADNPTLHRVAFEDAVKAALNAGFVLVGTSDLLENSADDHTLPQSDPSLERRTDRFVLKLQKPR